MTPVRVLIQYTPHDDKVHIIPLGLEKQIDVNAFADAVALQPGESIPTGVRSLPQGLFMKLMGL